MTNMTSTEEHVQRELERIAKERWKLDVEERVLVGIQVALANLDVPTKEIEV